MNNAQDTRGLSGLSLGLCSAVALSVVATSMFAIAADPESDSPRNKLPKRQHRSSNAPFLKPHEAVEKMAIPDGFEVSVFAAEPDIAEPIAFCFDDRGRMWVAENFNYQTRGRHSDEPISRIQILEDTNSDGVFDTKKTFTDKLTFTSGLAVGFGGVFVGSPPNFTFISDADGDDVPDSEPKVLLDGWGINDRHETLNSFIWGPDGWLYGCHGVFTQSFVGKPGAAKTDRQFIDAGIWRYHPTKDKFEVFARGLSNSWGFDFDDHGQGFATCCVIPHLFHVVQGGVFHKQSLPHVNPHIYDDIKTIRDHTHLSAHGGARFYLADTFPAEYRNRLFMCNIHEHAVLTDVMEPKGSGFVGKHGDDFMPMNDLAWVGFSVEIGPEGGVYILDWHDTDVCGNAVNFPNSGRVYRIMPTEAARAQTNKLARPNLETMSDLDLVDLQLNRNDWYVRHARLQLQMRAHAGQLDSTVPQILDQKFAAATTSAQRLRCLWALHVVGALNEERLLELLEHDDAHIRAWTIQLLCEDTGLNAFRWAGDSDKVLSDGAHERLLLMAQHDASPVVRLYLASAASRLSFAERLPILEKLAMHGEDADDHNLPRMVWFALEPAVMKNQEAALTLAVTGKMPKLQEFVSRRLASGDPGGEVVPDLESLFRRWRKRNQPKSRKQSRKKRLELLHEVAPGFDITNVGEGDVVLHSEFRNEKAVQVHPQDKETPCRLSQMVTVPEGKTTRLKLRVSHHPHGDWQLRVLADKEVLADQIVSSKTVTKEWLDAEVDLSSLAGKSLMLTIENRANDWANEWGYFSKIELVSE